MVVAQEERKAHKKKSSINLPNLQLVLNLLKLTLIGYCLWLLSHDIIRELLRRSELPQ